MNEPPTLLAAGSAVSTSRRRTLAYVPALHPRRARLVAACVLVGCAAVLGIARWLDPDPAGLGTHQQLGRLLGTHPLPPCTTTVLFGYPCPTCGMTTSFAHTVRGQFVAAVCAQPSGFLLALAALVAVPIAAGTLITGNVVRWQGRRMRPARFAILLTALLVGGWIYKLLVGIADGTLPIR